MELRRSSRTQSTASTVKNQPNGLLAKIPTAETRRSRTPKLASDAPSVSTHQDGTVENGVLKSMPPPTTPNKRRKLVKDESKPPPITPTPSAIGLMTGHGTAASNYSTGDIDDAMPAPPTRPAEPRHTNVTLLTPGGTEVPPTYSNFEESPSKPGVRPTTTTKSLLDDACAHLISVEPRLRTVIEQHYCRVFSPEGLAERIDPFRSLTSGIMAQQVSGAAASSIKNKFIALFPPEHCPSGYPSAAAVATTPLNRLREAGLSQRKAEYIQGLAEKFNTRELTVDMLMNGSDEEVMEKLVAVRGLGRWSVEMFMCFGLKRMDVFSTGDLGIQRGMAAFAGRDVAKLKAKGGKWKYMSEQDMVEQAERFRPYRSLFMWYMWRIEDVKVEALQES